MRLGVCVLLVGCEPTRAPLAAPMVERASRAPLAPPAPPEAARVEEAGPALCELSVRPRGGPRELAVYASPADVLGGEALATLRYEAARVRLVSADGSAAFATLSGYGLELSGYVHVRDLPIGLSASRTMAGGLIAPRLGELEIAEVDPDGVRVRIARHQLIDKAALPIEERVRCDELRADGEEVERGEGAAARRLRGSRGLELRPSPRAEDHAGFVLDSPAEGDLFAWELERRGGFVHILIQSSDGDLSGWVPSDKVAPYKGPFERRTRGEPSPPTRTSLQSARRCASALRFAVQTKGGPVWLGEVHAGVALNAEPTLASGPPPEGWRWITPTGLKAPVLVRSFDLDASKCGDDAGPKLTPP